MARIQFGSVITDSRGKIGGHQIRGSHFGQVLMNKQQPRNRTTETQQRHRAIVGLVTQLWQTTLTDEERQDWRTLAATQQQFDTWGNAYSLTAITLFLRLNVKRLAAGLAVLTTAPVDQVVTAPLTATLTIAAGPQIEVAFTGTPAPTNHRVRIYATPPQSRGVQNVSGRYQLLAISASAIASPIDITAEYLARFGAVAPNKQIFVQLTFWKTTNAAESPRLDTSAAT